MLKLHQSNEFQKDFKKYKKVNCLNGTAKNSLWKYFIEDNFELITLGHHYSRSLTHTHYIEDLLNVDYRFNKKFTIIYKDQNNKSSKKTYSFFGTLLFAYGAEFTVWSATRFNFRQTI